MFHKIKNNTLLLMPKQENSTSTCFVKHFTSCITDGKALTSIGSKSPRFFSGNLNGVCAKFAPEFVK